MNCNTVVKSIPLFLNDELDTDELKDFLEHIEYCPECKEELTIEILVNEGLNSLESGTNFDIKKEYNKCLSNAHHQLNKREGLKSFYYALTGLVGVGLLTVIALIVFL